MQSYIPFISHLTTVLNDPVSTTEPTFSPICIYLTENPFANNHSEMRFS